MQNKNLAILLILIAMVGTAAAQVPTVVVMNPDGNTYTTNYTTTVEVTFTVQDPDTNQSSMLLDLNYSLSNAQGTGTKILDDVNMLTTSGLTCASADFVTAKLCRYQWTIPYFTLNIDSPITTTYYILADVNDTNESVNRDFDDSNAFYLYTQSKSDALCSSISADANLAGGCVDGDGIEDAMTTAGAIGILEGGDKAGIMIFAFIIIVVLIIVGYAAGTFFGIWGKTKKMGN